MKTVLSSLVFCFIASPLWGILSWETTEITRKVGLLEKETVYVFRFMNVGNLPVNILEVKPDCGCTTAELKKNTYQPNETGEIIVTFKIGNRQGLQTKRIRVKTDVEDDNNSILVTKTIIPKLLEIKPKVTFWNNQSTPEPKVITIKASEDHSVAIKNVISSNPDFTVDLETLDEKTYQITVFPSTLEKGTRATITLITNYPKHEPKSYFTYVYVK